MAKATPLIVNTVFSVENLAKIRKLKLEHGALCDAKWKHASNLIAIIRK